MILTYELEIRKRACELVCDGSALGAALTSVCENAGHRERFFLSPFCLGAASSTTSPPAESSSSDVGNRVRKRLKLTRWPGSGRGGFKSKGKGRGRYKGKGKGKGKGKFSHTEDGQ